MPQPAEQLFLGETLSSIHQFDRIWGHPDIQAMWNGEVTSAAASLQEGTGVALVGPGGLGKSAGFTRRLLVRLVEQCTPDWQVYPFVLQDGDFGGKDGLASYNAYNLEPDDVTTLTDMGDPYGARGVNDSATLDSPRALILDEGCKEPDDPTKLQRWMRAFKRLDVLPVLIFPTETPQATATWVQGEAEAAPTELDIILPGNKRLPETALGEYMAAAGSAPELIDFVLEPGNSALRHGRLFSEFLLPRLLYDEYQSNKIPKPNSLNVFYPYIATVADLQTYLQSEQYIMSTPEVAETRVAIRRGIPVITGTPLESAYSYRWATSQELRTLSANLDVPYPDDERLRFLNAAAGKPDRPLEYGLE